MTAVNVSEGQAGTSPSTRVRLDLDASVVLPTGESLNVTVIDVSRRGVRLHVPEPLFMGETVELELGRSGYAKVMICWSKGSEVGSTFVDMR